MGRTFNQKMSSIIFSPPMMTVTGKILIKQFLLLQILAQESVGF